MCFFLFYFFIFRWFSQFGASFSNLTFLILIPRGEVIHESQYHGKSLIFLPHTFIQHLRFEIILRELSKN